MEEIPTKNIERLLKNVNGKIKKSEELAKLKGENFNLFSILGVETKENKAHSNFIAELLNPEGSHGLGTVFLELFYKMALKVVQNPENKEREKIKQWCDVIEQLQSEKKVSVITEKYLGVIDNENQEGGRVDIAITGKNGNIFIENKIYAGDQDKQILRYSKVPNSVVFYLTLDGHAPSEESSDELTPGKDFFLLSYKEDIKNWLKACQKEVSDFPIIRETIKQYLILIKKLTGQLTTNEMEKEIQSLLIQNIDSANFIANHLEEAKLSAVNDFFSLLQNVLQEELEKELKWHTSVNKLENKNWVSIHVNFENWDRDLYYNIERHPNGGYVNYGVVIYNKENNFSDKNFVAQVKKILGDFYYENPWNWIAGGNKLCVVNDSFLRTFHSANEKLKKGQINEIEQVNKCSKQIIEFIHKTYSIAEKINNLLTT
jgi:hypothetical protein